LQVKPQADPLHDAVAFAVDGGGQAVHEVPQLFGLLSLRQALPHR
jgi:hypothetical protein